MKKAIIITAIACCSLAAKAQDSDTKLKLQSASIGFGVFALQKNSDNDGGLTFLADATFSLGKNLISASYVTGEEFRILDGPQYHFNELSLLYGREWKAANWFRLEGFVGAGYYNQRVEDTGTHETKKRNTVSVPLRVNAKFYFTKKFGMGFCTNYSLNNLNNTFSENLIFHYRFN